MEWRKDRLHAWAGAIPGQPGGDAVGDVEARTPAGLYWLWPRRGTAQCTVALGSVRRASFIIGLVFLFSLSLRLNLFDRSRERILGADTVRLFT